ncbi:MAG: type II toxin-antitoxin system VapC family toxin [Saprospiraceae bacterium]
MNYLLDTHTFMWFVTDAPELSKKARNLMEQDDANLFLSIASIWEMAIKNSLGKLEIYTDFSTVPKDLTDNDIELLTIKYEHTAIVNRIPFHHKDPFDRMIVAQALFENMDVIGVDEKFDEYFEGTEIKRIW